MPVAAPRDEKSNEHCLSYELPGVAMSASAHAGVPAFAVTTGGDVSGARDRDFLINWLQAPVP
jgi:hypothetical protein